MTKLFPVKLNAEQTVIITDLLKTLTEKLEAYLGETRNDYIYAWDNSPLGVIYSTEKNVYGNTVQRIGVGDLLNATSVSLSSLRTGPANGAREVSKLVRRKVAMDRQVPSIMEMIAQVEEALAE